MLALEEKWEDWEAGRMFIARPDCAVFARPVPGASNGHNTTANNEQ